MRAVLLAGLLAAGQAAGAQPAPASLRFPSPRPVMDGVAERGTIRIAVPDDAPPFAWTGTDGVPTGYAVEVCRRVAASVASVLGRTLAPPGAKPSRATVRLDLVPTPVADEGAAVASGAVDLGCSAVPRTLGTRLVPSPALAVSGVRLLVTSLGAVSSMTDLAGRTVAVIPGTSAQAVVRRLRLQPAVRILPVPGPGVGYEDVATGAADAFAGNDLLLAGLLATHTDGPSLRIVGDEQTREPLTLVTRGGDPAFAAVVRRAMAEAAADGTLRTRYARWFTAALPEGAALDRPASRDTDLALAPPRP